MIRCMEGEKRGYTLDGWRRNEQRHRIKMVVNGHDVKIRIRITLKTDPYIIGVQDLASYRYGT